MARDYEKGRRERESLIRELAALGLGTREIAEMTRWSESTVLKDIQSMGGMRQIAPERLRKKIDLFAAVFQRYAELVCDDTPTSEMRSLKDTLGTWLTIDLSILHNMMEVMAETLLLPSFPPELKPYFNLLETTYGNSRHAAEYKILHHMQYLSCVAAKRRPAPKSRRELVEALTVQAAEACRELIAPKWPADAKQQIDSVLTTLSARQQQVLRLHFGLDGEKPGTLAKVGAVLGCGRDQAGQIYEEAWRQLRLNECRNKLAPFIEPLENVAVFRAAHDTALNQAAAELQTVREQIERLRAELDVARALTGQTSSDENVGATSLTIAPHLVEELDVFLEISVRSVNCLVNAHLHYVWELVERTEAQILKIKNFGRKSFDELIAELARHGLKLGTVFPPAVRLRLEAASEARPRVSR